MTLIDSPNLDTRDILAAARDGRAPTPAETAHLFSIRREADMRALQEAADAVRSEQAGDTVFYADQVSILMTNQCELQPSPPDGRAWTLTIDEIDAALETARQRRSDQIFLSSGGLWGLLRVPGLEGATLLKTWARVLEYLHEHSPAPILGFCPDEIELLHIVSDRSHRYILEYFKDRGLAMLGGHRAVIFSDPVRHAISPKLASVKTWFAVAEAAHRLQIPMTVSLGYGHGETMIQRAEHLALLRQFQVRHPGAFRLLTLSPDGNQAIDASERRRVQAVCRLVVGEFIPIQQATWTLDTDRPAEEAQEQLTWGANHLGTTDALAWPAFLKGSHQADMLTPEELAHLAADAGRLPKRHAFMELGL